MTSKSNVKIIHCAGLLAPSTGMLNQMRWEFDEAIALGISWHVRMYCPLNSTSASQITHFDSFLDSNKIGNKLIKLLAWIALRWRYNQWLLSLQNEFDIFVLRYYVHDPFQLWFIFRSKKPVFFVHHTLEIPELAMPKTLASVFRSILEAFFGKLSLPFAKGIIGVTDEIVQYEIKRANLKNKPCYIYPNGIRYENINLVDQRDEYVPELLFVANFAPWHGLDLLFESIRRNAENFKLHIVGEIPKSLISIAHSDARIVLHGKLSHYQIIELSQCCWLGLSSFALWRNKMTQACPLKVREYLMNGLSVYGDYNDVFPKEFLFYKKGPADIAFIIDYARKIRIFSKEDVSDASRKLIEKKSLLSLLHSNLSHAVKVG
jgi:glycosyltransferase involved in cell wall biosynthesis